MTSYYIKVLYFKLNSIIILFDSKNRTPLYDLCPKSTPLSHIITETISDTIVIIFLSKGMLCIVFHQKY